MPYSLWSREAIKELIDKKYGFKVPLRTITDYLKRWSMTCQRPAKMATKQNASAVKEFQEVTFPKIVEKARKEHGMIFFGDEIARQKRKNQYDLRNKSTGSLQIYVLFRHFDVATAD